MLQDGLATLIAGAAEITEIVGTPSTRQDQTNGIFSGKANEAANTPFIVYSQISGGGNPSMDGASSLHDARMQFACYGKSYSDAKYLQRAVKRLLEGLHTTLAEGTEVDNAILVLELDAWEQSALLHTAPIDFQFVFADVGT